MGSPRFRIQTFLRARFCRGAVGCVLLLFLEMATLNQTLQNAQKVFDFKELRDKMREEVKKADDDADAFFGKREATEFFPTDSSFEDKKNKVVKVSDVIATLNLMAGEFIVRTWPDFLLAKIREYVVGKIAGAAGKAAAVKITTAAGKKAISGAIGAVVGAFFTTGIQKAEMEALEKEIRAGMVRWRRELNGEALAQSNNSGKVGPTLTRHV